MERWYPGEGKDGDSFVVNEARAGLDSNQRLPPCEEGGLERNPTERELPPHRAWLRVVLVLNESCLAGITPALAWREARKPDLRIRFSAVTVGRTPAPDVRLESLTYRILRRTRGCGRSCSSFPGVSSRSIATA